MIEFISIFVSSFYSNPENPRNAIAIRPAVTSTIGDPWKLYDIISLDVLTDTCQKHDGDGITNGCTNTIYHAL